MPDFAVEIQSPDDDLRDMREKAEYYLSKKRRKAPSFSYGDIRCSILLSASKCLTC